MKLAVLVYTLPHDPIYTLLTSHVCKKQSRRGVWHLTGEPKARSLQPAKTLSRGHIATAVTSGEILKDSPYHSNIAGLNALSNIVQEALALLGCNATLWQHSNGVGNPCSNLLRVELEEVEEYA